MLDADYMKQAEYRARRFSGAYTGTAGGLAADTLRLLGYVRELQQEIERMSEMTWMDGSQGIRDAVAARYAARVEAEECCGGARMCKPAPAVLSETTEPEPLNWKTYTLEPAVAPEAIPADWIIRGAAELDAADDEPMRFAGDSLLRGDGVSVAETVLLDALDVIRDRRQKYGAAPEHFARTIGMINVAFADVLVRPLTPSDWALFIMLDKIGRYTGTGLKTKDFAIDLAGYAACLRECETPEVIE